MAKLKSKEKKDGKKEVKESKKKKKMKARMGITRIRETVELPVDCANVGLLVVVFCVNCCNLLNSYVFCN